MTEHPLGPSPELTEEYRALLSVVRTFCAITEQPIVVVRPVVDCLIEAAYVWLASVGEAGLIPPEYLNDPTT